MNEENTTTPWHDPDDAPNLTREWFQNAEVREGDRIVRPGRPKLDNPKQALSLRLDAEVIAFFKKDGAGWQRRINDALRKVAGL